MAKCAIFEAMLLRFCILAAVAGTLLGQQAGSEVWRFDNLDRIGGYPVTVVGHPRVVATPIGKAIAFGGVEDAIYLDVHPLAGAAAFTWEVIFRPDPGGAPEQRFFHLSVLDPKTGKDTPDRMLFEIRVIDSRWCLDSFALSGTASKALIDRGKLHSLGAWHHAALVYDGGRLSNYVDGEMQGSAEVRLAPQGPGHCSIGVRIDRRDYFKGAVFEARMTRRALSTAEFLRVPE
jgi:hypothetical protein